jgi:predicted cupin superfamily sugar epimerase
MHSRAEELINTLQLSRHPEGGFFREIYRSVLPVQPRDARPERAALTTIYFLLSGGFVSRWHRVSSDEVWHFFEGDTLELLETDAKFERFTTKRLGPLTDGAAPVHVVEAGVWQAARSTGEYTLVGCTVGPGFDFADFEMLSALPSEADALSLTNPYLASFI